MQVDGRDQARVAGGEAFTIEDAAVALRWSSLVRERGVRLAVSTTCRHADEVIEVRKGSRSTARIHRGRHVVWLTDHAGCARVFATLTDALLAIEPLTAADRRWMLRGPAPACLRLPAVVVPHPTENTARRAWAAICAFVRAHTETLFPAATGPMGRHRPTA